MFEDEQPAKQTAKKSSAKPTDPMFNELSKTLKKFEKNNIYLSDDEENPYASQDSDSDDDFFKSEADRGTATSPFGSKTLGKKREGSPGKGSSSASPLPRSNSPEALLEALQKEKSKREAKMGGASPPYAKASKGASPLYSGKGIY